MAISVAANIEGIQQFTTAIWDEVLQLPLEPSANCDLAGDDVLSASVRITGAWRGKVTLLCRRSFAARAAQIMFQLAPSALQTADIHDAVGELANMIGGQFKALMPEPSHLSMPYIGGVTPCDPADEIARTTMNCQGEPLVLIISDVDASAMAA